MKRKQQAGLIILILSLAFLNKSYANFDYSLFQNNDMFTFKYDRWGDIDDIDLASESYQPLENIESDKGNVNLSLEVYYSENGDVKLGIEITIPGMVINSKKIVFIPDTTKYTVYYLSGWRSRNDEYLVFTITPDLFPMIDEIIEKNISVVKYQLSGNIDIYGTISVKNDVLKTIYECYKKAGGENQDFSVDNIIQPVISD